MKLVVNLLGAPGTGKSTTAAKLFAALKELNVNCELVTEYAKELVWHKRSETMKDELYLFAKQNHRLCMLRDQVEIIVTDRPIILSSLYNQMYGDNSEVFHDLVIHETNKYPNLNILLNRVKPYNPKGRVQTEEESDGMKPHITKLLDSCGQEYTTLDADLEVVDKIIDMIQDRKGYDV